MLSPRLPDKLASIPGSSLIFVHDLTQPRSLLSMHEEEQSWLQMQPFPYSPLLLEVFQVHCPYGLLLLLSKERAAKSLYSYDHLCFISH